ncbi:MAG: precorrin-3B C(17)-methyltransferase [Planctomycetes bacterium]|nr:precorrin-3B C(17)-methyltransferase [Planctomycetota bacterium]
MVGIGPGGRLDRTLRAVRAITDSSIVVGYGRYLGLIEDLTGGKKLIASGMKKEVERCRAALNAAQEGNIVSLVSSGDPGIYGMAGLAFELAAAESMRVVIEIVPGVTAAGAAAARLGAPLMVDFACISLSDLLVPWETIKERLEAVAAADLAVALYNPRSKKRVTQLEEAARIFRQHRNPDTPVGIATAVSTDDERVVLSDLEHFLQEEIGMRSIVLIGNRSSKRIGKWFVTPRGYNI